MVIEWHSPACSCPCALCLPVLSPSVVVSAPWTQDIKIACICGDSQLTLVTSWASCRGSTVGWGRWAGYRHSGQPARWSRSANKHCCKVKCYLDIVFAEPMPIHNTTQSTLSPTLGFWYSMMSKTTSSNLQCINGLLHFSFTSRTKNLAGTMFHSNALPQFVFLELLQVVLSRCWVWASARACPACCCCGEEAWPGRGPLPGGGGQGCAGAMET